MGATAKSAHDIEYTNWLKKIDSYKTELTGMQKQLEQVLKDYYSKALAARGEQFQNRFIRQREVIDILRHDVKAHENDLQALEAKDNDSLRERVKNIRWKLRDEVRTFKDLFVELERDFSDFLA